MMLNENKAQIEKRKIANMIAQGESGNIHAIIHLPEIKEQIVAISPRLFELYDIILKSNDDILFQMFSTNVIDDDGFKVLKNDLLNKYNSILRNKYDFNSNFKFRDVMEAIEIQNRNREAIVKIATDCIKQQYGNITKQINILANLIDFTPTSVVDSLRNDVAKYQAKNIVGSTSGLNGYNIVIFDIKKINKDVQQELFREIKNGTQLDQLNSNKLEDYFKDERFTVVAKSVLLPTLLHEIILGMYEIIISPSIPKENAEDILSKTDTIENEYMDYLYGRPFRDDIVSFIVSVSDTISNSDDVPNLKEYIFGTMMQMEDNAFLNLIKGIIDNTSSAKKTMSNIISEIVEKHMAWKNKKRIVKKVEPVKKEVEKGLDYSKLSQSQLQGMLNIALDNEKYDEVDKIAKFIK